MNSYQSRLFPVVLLAALSMVDCATAGPNDEPPESFGLRIDVLNHAVNGNHMGRVEPLPDRSVKWVVIQAKTNKLPDGRVLERVDGGDHSIMMIGDRNKGYIAPYLGPHTNALYKCSPGAYAWEFNLVPAKEIPAGVAPKGDSYCVPYETIGRLDREEFVVQRTYMPEKERLAVAEVMLDRWETKKIVLLRTGDDFEIGKHRFKVRDVVARDGKHLLAGWLELDPFGVAIDAPKDGKNPPAGGAAEGKAPPPETK